MKLRNKILNRCKLLLFSTLFIEIIFIIASYSFGTEEGNKLMLFFLGLLGINLLFIIIVIGLHLLTKTFDNYYKSLSQIEREQFESEIKKSYHGQNIIITSHAIVTVNFITIKAIPFEQIVSISKENSMIHIHGKNGLLDAVPLKNPQEFGEIAEIISVIK